jgi:hypothetical protein
VIEWGTLKQNADVFNNGPGAVFFSWRKTAAVDDPHCVMLEEGQPFRLFRLQPWDKLSFISADAAAVQVVVR